MAAGLIETDNKIAESILYVLHYYSIFSYPLTAEEIHRDCPTSCSISAIEEGLEQLLQEERIYRFQNHYSIQQDIKRLINRRLQGNRLAEQCKAPAMRAGRLIFAFPFVRFVGISGSLSKGYAEPGSDFDFFIVAASHRLWVCRTLLHLFKKLSFLVGQQHKFCMNYFVDMESLEIAEKNRFTAVELNSMIPVRGWEVYQQMMDSNAWIADHLPNATPDTAKQKKEQGTSAPVKKGLEYLLDKCFGRGLNARLMHITDKRWRKKWKARNYPQEDYALAFKTSLHVSKNHPANHQKRVLNFLATLPPLSADTDVYCK